MTKKNKILVIQTAFIGDVILATSFLEQVVLLYPELELHILVREGVESLLQHHPKIKKVWVWGKKKNKFRNLYRLIKEIRLENFDIIFNIQRFFSSGLLTAFSGANLKVGFDTNPLSSFFTHAVKHLVPYITMEGHYHEVQRNFLLLQALHPNLAVPKAQDLKPKLYFGHELLDANIQQKNSYVVIAPTSVWFTKQWLKEKWIDLVKMLPANYSVFLVGSKDDFSFCQDILDQAQRPLTVNTCGKLSLLQTAILMKNASRVISNDSAPLHLASAVNAPTTAIFCSTIKEFGFGPLSDESTVLEVQNLSCRPCGIHGHQSCPLNHFKCANDIKTEEVVKSLYE